MIVHILIQETAFVYMNVFDRSGKCQFARVLWKMGVFKRTPPDREFFEGVGWD